MSTSTIRLHRVLQATPERIYRAFLDPDAMAKWLPPNGFTGKVHHMDAKVGGTYKMSFTNFSTGKSHSFGGTFLELVPHERLRYTDKFDDPSLPGEMLTTVTLKKVSCGTELTVVQENIDAKTLRGMLERGERVTVVDVRRGKEHAEGAIPGSVSFDAYDALNAGDERAMEGLRPPDGELVVTVCNRGRAGAVAAEQLRRRGYQALSLEGGLESWKAL